MKPLLGILGPIGWPELLVILGLVLVIFGPRRLPEIAESFGKSIRKFKSATHDAGEEVRRELDDIKRSGEGHGRGEAERRQERREPPEHRERPAAPDAAPDRDRP